MSTALARQDDDFAAQPFSSPGAPSRSLSRREKAAIVVRLLLAEGVKLPLMSLPAALQAELISQMSRMRFIDRQTLREVAEEFATELDGIGLAFPGGVDGALKALEGAISADVIARMRAQSGAFWGEDPWETISRFDVPKLVEIMQRESPEIGAVILSKLDVSKAAELLGKLPGPEARRLTIAVSDTADVMPDTVRCIGAALAAQLQAEPPRAFTAASVERIGAILDVSPGPTREEVLAGLEEEDREFADRVRAAIFTFVDIPERVDPKDVAIIAKTVEQPSLVAALAGAAGDPKMAVVSDFILSKLPGRLADTIRTEVAEFGPVDATSSEAAQIAVVRAVRRLVDSGEIKLVTASD
ncbi:FliG C-terminal domain-containing protein [Palleronia sp.]|uniref:FliG C-terminal domain-containing protein n=1 Tax=Palleronia sp. TaxID=1940284 RepID=UPI0035C7C213